MATYTNENAEWIEWLPTAADLAFTERFALTQGGPKERSTYLRARADQLRECGVDPKQIALDPIDTDTNNPCWWDIQIFGWTDTATIITAGVASALDPRGAGNRNVLVRGTLKYLGNDFEFDIGGGAHFSIYAPSVSLGIIAPTGTLRVGVGGQSNFVGTPMAPVNVTSVAINGIITACVRPSNLTRATLTETRVLVATADIPVPAKARTLQIFQNTASLPATPMNWVQDSVTGFDLGQVDFQLAGAPARTDILDVPAAASILRTGAAARTVTLVWGLAL